MRQDSDFWKEELCVESYDLSQLLPCRVLKAWYKERKVEQSPAVLL
jgi:hypothetical protein